MAKHQDKEIPSDDPTDLFVALVAKLLFMLALCLLQLRPKRGNLFVRHGRIAKQACVKDETRPKRQQHPNRNPHHNKAAGDSRRPHVRRDICSRRLARPRKAHAPLRLARKPIGS